MTPAPTSAQPRLPGTIPALAALLALFPGRVHSEAFDFRFDCVQETREHRPMIAARGTTNLPETARLHAGVAYRKGSSNVALVARVAEVQPGGAFEIPLDPGFGERPFPGTYAVTVTFDPSRQEGRRVLPILPRIRRPIVRESSISFGAAEDARPAEADLRRQWLARIDALAALGDELAAAFEQQVGRVNPPAWDRWRVPWARRLRDIGEARLSRAEAAILPDLETLGAAAAALSGLLADVSTHAETALRGSPIPPGDVRRVRQWLEHYRSRIEAARIALGISARPPETALARLFARVTALEHWVAGWRAGAPGFGAPQWDGWRDTWQQVVGEEILFLSTQPGDGAALLDAAHRLRAATDAVDAAVRAGDDAPVAAALARARRTLQDLHAPPPAGPRLR